MGRYIMELALYHVFKTWFAAVHRFHDGFWQAGISERPFWGMVDFDAAIGIMKTQVKTSMKRVSVGQKWPNHGVWEYKSSISSGDFKKQAFSPFWCMSSHLFSTTCYLGKPNSAAHDVIWIGRENSIIIRGNASARATAKPCMIKWFHLGSPEYYLTATEMENSADLNAFFDILIIIIIYYTPHQMHSDLLISGVKTLGRVITLLINTFSCICEGLSWWGCITDNYVSVGNKILTKLGQIWILCFHPTWTSASCDL